jgi:hypothetical protein
MRWRTEDLVRKLFLQMAVAPKELSGISGLVPKN